MARIDQLPGLRRPIRTEINGQVVELLTVGYVARVLDRTVWTIRHWQKIGLFPKAPFMINPDDYRGRRSLYPASFVLALQKIGDRGYLGGRLNRDRWRLFHDQVWDAYEQTVAPLHPCVIGSPGDDGDEGGQVPA
jgi:hypothetical protein